MSLSAILLVILILMLIGAFPRWPYNRDWGYGPVGLVLVILLVLALTGHVRVRAAPVVLEPPAAHIRM